MRLYARVRRDKTEPEIINRAGGQACFQAMGKTPKAKLGKFPLNATANPEKGGKTYKQRIFYALAAKQGATKPGVFDAANKLYKRRRSAKGAIAAGFFRPMRQLGFKSTRNPLKGGIEATGTAGLSRGKKARSGRGRMEAKSINEVDGAFEVGGPAMEQAIPIVIADMQDWATRQLQKTNNRFSAKRR